MYYYHDKLGLGGSSFHLIPEGFNWYFIRSVAFTWKSGHYVRMSYGSTTSMFYGELVLLDF